MDHFLSDELSFEVVDGGPIDGPVVVLLHGFPQDHHAFDAVAAPLQRAGMRTLAPLQRGYSSDSTPRRELGHAAYRMEALVGDVIALLDAAGAKQAHVVGHDWGGAVAWALAGHHPDRVATLTVLSTPHPHAIAWASRRGGQALKSWYIGAFQLPWLPERVLPVVLPTVLRRSGLPDADLARYRAALGDLERARAMLGWYRALRHRDAFDRLPRVTAATTLIWGRDDLALGRAAAERSARYVEADYRFVELDANHWLPETHPEVVADLVLQRIHG